jgi:hypothetical protein
MAAAARAAAIIGTSTRAARPARPGCLSLAVRPENASLRSFFSVAVGLAIGLQIADAGARPAAIREAAAFRAAHVDGLGTFVPAGRTILVTPLHPTRPHTYRLPWTRRTVRLAA